MADSIRFAKMQGIGNDFIAFERSWLNRFSPADFAPIWCDRHFGIGADGLIIIEPSTNPECAFKFSMHNPDGTPDMCGNGLRCAVLLAYRIGLLPESVTKFNVETLSGVHECETLDVDADHREAMVKVEMGVPSFDPSVIPVDMAVVVDSIFRLNVGGSTIELFPVNTGSTHSVVFVDQLPTDDTFFEIGPQIEMHLAFPERTSILWAKTVANDTYEIRIWERGAGETLGCGTGACAVAAAAIKSKRSSFGRDIEVVSKGGTLTINWPSPTETLLMSGPGTWAFDGQL